MAQIFQATPENVNAYLKSVGSADELDLGEVIQKGFLIAAVHDTEAYPLDAFVDGLAKLGFGRGAVTRYIAGIAQPHEVIHQRVRAFVQRHLTEAVLACREQDTRLSEALSAHNMLIQQPGYDTEGFFRTLNEDGPGAAIAESVDGKFNPESDGE